MILAAVRNMLLADPDVFAKTGSRIYPLTSSTAHPVNPIIILGRISQITNTVNSARTSRVQIDCYDETYQQAAELAADVSKALTNKTRQQTDLVIMDCIPQNSIDYYDPAARAYRTSQDYLILWRPAN